MKSFFEILEDRAKKINSLICVGIDPHEEDIEKIDKIKARYFKIIDQTSEYALAYKPNVAFFQKYGYEGWKLLKDIIDYISIEIPVIIDAKIGDISSTTNEYATAMFDILGADAITLNPYIGYDGLKPFIDRKEKGCFILCKTSNAGSKEFQDQKLESGLRLYEHVAISAESWNTNGNVGIVFGATYPDEMKQLRKIVSDLWILAPGVGAQGGNLNDLLESGLREDGLGLLINVSRGITKSENPRLDIRSLCNSIRLKQYEMRK